MSTTAVTKLDEFTVPMGMVDLNAISQKLIEQMDQVSKNPAHIPQAESACMIAGRIIEIAKTQVSQAQAINDLIRTKNGI